MVFTLDILGQDFGEVFVWNTCDLALPVLFHIFSPENQVGPVVLSHASYDVSSKSPQGSFIGTEAT